MAKVLSKTISWTPSPSSDVVAHRVYVNTTSVDYNSPHIDVPMPGNSITAPDDFPAGTFSGDMNYFIGVSAMDDVENESDIVEISAPFDFIAPDVPTNIIVS